MVIGKMFTVLYFVEIERFALRQTSPPRKVVLTLIQDGQQ